MLRGTRHGRQLGAVAAAALIVTTTALAVSVTSADAAATATPSRAPYVTDLTSTSAYVNWAVVATSTPLAGSLAYVPAPVSGPCPAQITWASGHPATTEIPLIATTSSGTTTQAGWEKSDGADNEYQNGVQLTGLTPNTSYCYATYLTNASGPQIFPTQSFTTLDTPGTTPSSKALTFDVIADTGEIDCALKVPCTGDLNTGEEAIYKDIATSGAQFLVVAGDVAYSDGSATDYGDLLQPATSSTEMSNVFGPNYIPQANGIPTFVADGNHGQNVNDLRIWPEPVTSAQGSYAFAQTTTTVDGISGQFPEAWYAIQSGNTRIYVLDGAWSDGSSSATGYGSATGSLCGASAADCQGYQADYDEHWSPSAAQYQWLKADLAAHPGGVKLAVWHYPLRSVDETQPSDPYLQNSSANPNASTSLEKLLASNGVQVAFNGHAHTYQRVVPTNFQANGQLANFVTGGGGGVLSPIDTKSDNGSKALCNPLLATANVYALGWNPTTAGAGGSGTECSTGNVALTPTQADQVYNYLKVTVLNNVVTVVAYNALNQPFDSYSFTYGTTPPPTAPATPTGLHSTGMTTTTASLSWTASAGATAYDVFRNGVKVSTAQTGTTFADSGLTPGTTYQYTVDASNTAGTSATTAALPVTTQSAVTPPPPGIALIQSGSTTSGTTIPLASSTTSGNLLVLEASLFTGASNNITSVTDTAGDSWTKVMAVDVSGHNSDGELWYTFAKAPSSSVTVATKASAETLEVQEFSGVAGADSSGSGKDDTTAATASATPTTTGDLAVGFVAGHANTEAITPTGGYTSPAQVTGSNTSLATGYQVLSSTGATSFGGTFATAMYWAAGVALFTP